MMKLRRLATVDIRNELIRVRYLKDITTPHQRAGKAGEIREVPRHVGYQMVLKKKAEIVSDRSRYEKTNRRKSG